MPRQSLPAQTGLAPHPTRVSRRKKSTENCRSEEHTSELQSQSNLVCRLLLEKKKTCRTTTGCESNRLLSAPAPVFVGSGERPIRDTRQNCRGHHALFDGMTRRGHRRAASAAT